MTAVKMLRQWRWGRLATYNGFCHTERVRGWQLIMWRIDNKWWQRPSICCISGQFDNLTLHSENYYSWEPYTLHHSIHMALHRRFKQHDTWQRIVGKYAASGDEWFVRLSVVPVDLAGALRAKYGPETTDIFARAPVPEGVTVPYHQIYSQREYADGN